MTTATADSPLASLEQLETRWRKDSATAAALGREHAELIGRLGQLDSERRRIAHRDPASVDHTGAAASGKPGAAIREIDKEIAKLADPAEAEAKVRHARAIADHAKREVEAHVTANYEEIVVALTPAAEEVATAVADRIADLTAALDRFVGFHQRTAGLAAAARRDTRTVPGIEEAGRMRRLLRDLAPLPAPVAEVER